MLIPVVIEIVCKKDVFLNFSFFFEMSKLKKKLNEAFLLSSF